MTQLFFTLFNIHSQIQSSHVQHTLGHPFRPTNKNMFQRLKNETQIFPFTQSQIKSIHVQHTLDTHSDQLTEK